jgi:CheY-like chemotaxis protein
MGNQTLDFKYRQVMLVDDSELDNFINERIITSSNFSSGIYVNNSVISALELINDIVDKPETAENFPDVIFIDLNMPVMSGYEFINKIKVLAPEQVSKTKLVILTSSVNEQEKMIEEGISGQVIYLNKPLTRQMLETI